MFLNLTNFSQKKLLSNTQFYWFHNNFSMKSFYYEHEFLNNLINKRTTIISTGHGCLMWGNYFWKFIHGMSFSLFFLLNLSFNINIIIKLFILISVEYNKNNKKNNIHVEYFVYSLRKDQNFGRNVDVLWISICTRLERPPISFSKLKYR